MRLIYNKQKQMNGNYDRIDVNEALLLILIMHIIQLYHCVKKSTLLSKFDDKAKGFSQSTK